MTYPFDAVVLSTNLDPTYYELFPLVRRAWRKFFNDIPVHLAVVGEGPELKKILNVVDDDNVRVYHPVVDIPVPNQAKLARYFLGSQLPGSTRVLISDIDWMPLDPEFLVNLLSGRPDRSILAIGSELYTGFERGKFMAAPLLLEARTVQHLFVAPGVRWFADFINQFVGINKFDHKEDVRNSTGHEHPDTFSDESLMRYLLSIKPVPVVHRRADHWPARVLDRANWQLDLTRLSSRGYTEAHLPRPAGPARDALLKPLWDYAS